jgi:hypothetical protein
MIYTKQIEEKYWNSTKQYLVYNCNKYCRIKTQENILYILWDRLEDNVITHLTIFKPDTIEVYRSKKNIDGRRKHYFHFNYKLKKMYDLSCGTAIGKEYFIKDGEPCGNILSKYDYENKNDLGFIQVIKINGYYEIKQKNVSKLETTIKDDLPCDYDGEIEEMTLLKELIRVPNSEETNNFPNISFYSINDDCIFIIWQCFAKELSYDKSMIYNLTKNEWVAQIEINTNKQRRLSIHTEINNETNGYYFKANTIDCDGEIINYTTSIPWNIERLLWIAISKENINNNNNNICYLSMLPKDIIKLIIQFINTYDYYGLQ